MSRTQRIWQRKPHPERLPFCYKIKPYASDKSRLCCINRIWKIRNRLWRILRYRNKVNCKSIVKNITDSDEVDTNIKSDYTEYFD
jgi:hypothetical protein